MGKILYTAVVLTNQSHGKLMMTLGGLIPDDWKKFAHHMTVVFGQGLPENLEKYDGMNVKLTATKLGISDKAIAVKVEGFYSNNDIPHITIAVNTQAGGKPFDSNKITDWKPLSEVTNVSSIEFDGVVTEVKAN